MIRALTVAGVLAVCVARITSVIRSPGLGMSPTLMTASRTRLEPLNSPCVEPEAPLTLIQ
jgi:hypothetical protein